MEPFDRTISVDEFKNLIDTEELIKILEDFELIEEDK